VSSTRPRTLTSGAVLLAVFGGLLHSVTTAAEDGPPSSDALDRLKQRSAEVRWDESVDEWLPLESRRAPRIQDADDAWRSGNSKPAPASTSLPVPKPVASPPTPLPVDEPIDEAPPTANVPAPISENLVEPAPAELAPDQPETLPRPRSYVAGEHVGGLLQPEVLIEPDELTAPAAPIGEPVVRSSERAPPAPEALIATEFDVPAARAQEYLSLQAFLSGAPLVVSRLPDEHATTIQLLVDDPSVSQSEGRAMLPAPDFIGLRPITNIVPFRTYSPDGSDPCEHLCPVPEACEGSTETLCPGVYELPVVGSTDRVFSGLNYYWLASNVSYNPLYFEDPTLERYGHVHIHDCIEPLYGIGRFGVQLLGLPYQMAMRSPCDQVSPLGYFRPGEPAPKQHYQIPFDGRAAAIATGVYTGLFFLVP